MICPVHHIDPTQAEVNNQITNPRLSPRSYTVYSTEMFFRKTGVSNGAILQGLEIEGAEMNERIRDVF